MFVSMAHLFILLFIFSLDLYKILVWNKIEHVVWNYVTVYLKKIFHDWPRKFNFRIVIHRDLLVVLRISVNWRNVRLDTSDTTWG